jgi:hypothetical protein
MVELRSGHEPHGFGELIEHPIKPPADADPPGGIRDSGQLVEVVADSAQLGDKRV